MNKVMLFDAVLWNWSSDCYLVYQFVENYDIYKCVNAHEYHSVTKKEFPKFQLVAYKYTKEMEQGSSLVIYDDDLREQAKKHGIEFEVDYIAFNMGKVNSLHSPGIRSFKDDD